MLEKTSRSIKKISKNIKKTFKNIEKKFKHLVNYHYRNSPYYENIKDYRIRYLSFIETKFKNSFPRLLIY